MGWAGWGAGPSGAGAAGGPSRGFLWLALAGSVAVAVAMTAGRRWPAALAASAAVVYFALRLFGGLGRRGNP
ncbi:MAG TPA: hypothetical protein VIV59_12435 [Anaeromyxobacteraceae bacterium]